MYYVFNEIFKTIEITVVSKCHTGFFQVTDPWGVLVRVVCMGKTTFYTDGS